MKEWSEDEEVSEVITINKEYYDAICSYLIENANKENDDMTCEARLYVQISEHEMCIGDLGCACDINDKDIPANINIVVDKLPQKIEIIAVIIAPIAKFMQNNVGTNISTITAIIAIMTYIAHNSISINLPS